MAADEPVNHLDVLAGYGLHVKVREVRLRQGISQRELARRTDIYYSRLCQKESGQLPWSLVDLLRSSEALNTPLWELVEILWPMPTPVVEAQMVRNEAQTICAKARKARAASQRRRNGDA